MKLALAKVFSVKDKEDNMKLPNASTRSLVTFEDFAMISQQYWPAGGFVRSIHIDS